MRTERSEGLDRRSVEARGRGSAAGADVEECGGVGVRCGSDRIEERKAAEGTRGEVAEQPKSRAMEEVADG